ncbi:hypothetical protein D3C76_999780 [compost metagenome]
MDISPLTLIERLFSESASTDIQPAIILVPTAQKATDFITPHPGISMFDLHNNAWWLKSKSIGGSNYVFTPISTGWGYERLVAHCSQDPSYQFLHFSPIQTVDLVLNPLECDLLNTLQRVF